MARTLIIDSIKAAGRTFKSGEELKIASGELEVLVNNEKIEEDFYALITSEPEMPLVEVKNGTKNVVKGRFKIEYQKPYDGGIARKILDYFPESDNDELNTVTIEAKKGHWQVDFGDKIRGGRITFEYTICQDENCEIRQSDLTETFVFYIRGENPTAEEIRDYVNQENYVDDYWFLIRLLRHESGTGEDDEFRQFNPGESYGPNWTDFIGCPNFGPPRGWGISQIDNINRLNRNERNNLNLSDLEEGQTIIENNRTIDENGYVVASDEALWNWKENINFGILVLNNKTTIVSNYLSRLSNEVRRWNEEHPNNLVVFPEDQIEGNITFSNVNTSTEELLNFNNITNGEPTDTVKSFFDAMIIKAYNGLGTEGLHYLYYVNNNQQNKPILRLQRYASYTLDGEDRTNYYVEDICSEQN